MEVGSSKESKSSDELDLLTKSTEELRSKLDELRQSAAQCRSDVEALVGAGYRVWVGSAHTLDDIHVNAKQGQRHAIRVHQLLEQGGPAHASTATAHTSTSTGHDAPTDATSSSCAPCRRISQLSGWALAAVDAVEEGIQRSQLSAAARLCRRAQHILSRLCALPQSDTLRTPPQTPSQPAQTPPQPTQTSPQPTQIQQPPAHPASSSACCCESLRKHQQQWGRSLTMLAGYESVLERRLDRVLTVGDAALLATLDVLGARCLLRTPWSSGSDDRDHWTAELAALHRQAFPDRRDNAAQAPGITVSVQQVLSLLKSQTARITHILQVGQAAVATACGKGGVLGLEQLRSVRRALVFMVWRVVQCVRMALYGTHCLLGAQTFSGARPRFVWIDKDEQAQAAALVRAFLHGVHRLATPLFSKCLHVLSSSYTQGGGPVVLVSHKHLLRVQEVVLYVAGAFPELQLAGEPQGTPSTAPTPTPTSTSTPAPAPAPAPTELTIVAATVVENVPSSSLVRQWVNGLAAGDQRSALGLALWRSLCAVLFRTKGSGNSREDDPVAAATRDGVLSLYRLLLHQAVVTAYKRCLLEGVRSRAGSQQDTVGVAECWQSVFAYQQLAEDGPAGSEEDTQPTPGGSADVVTPGQSGWAGWLSGAAGGQVGTAGADYGVFDPLDEAQRGPGDVKCANVPCIPPSHLLVRNPFSVRVVPSIVRGITGKMRRLVKVVGALWRPHALVLAALNASDEVPFEVAGHDELLAVSGGLRQAVFASQWLSQLLVDLAGSVSDGGEAVLRELEPSSSGPDAFLDIEAKGSVVRCHQQPVSVKLRQAYVLALVCEALLRADSGFSVFASAFESGAGDSAHPPVGSKSLGNAVRHGMRRLTTLRQDALALVRQYVVKVVFDAQRWKGWLQQVREPQHSFGVGDGGSETKLTVSGPSQVVYEYILHCKSLLSGIAGMSGGARLLDSSSVTQQLAFLLDDVLAGGSQRDPQALQAWFDVLVLAFAFGCDTCAVSVAGGDSSLTSPRETQVDPCPWCGLRDAVRKHQLPTHSGGLLQTAVRGYCLDNFHVLLPSSLAVAAPSPLRAAPTSDGSSESLAEPEPLFCEHGPSLSGLGLLSM